MPNSIRFLLLFLAMLALMTLGGLFWRPTDQAVHTPVGIGSRYWHLSDSERVVVMPESVMAHPNSLHIRQ